MKKSFALFVAIMSGKYMSPSFYQIRPDIPI